VRRIVIRAVKVGLAASAALGILVFASTGLREVLLDAYLLAIGGVLLLALVRTTRAKAPAGGPSELEHALDTMEIIPADSGDLALVRDLELSTMSAFHLHVRLRPLLREIAAHRLRKRYGVELESELIGTAAWELVRPNRPPPAERLAHGPPLSHLRQVVDELERV
jgi:hypothetical protein